jgi:hypothetical protein
MHYNVSPKKLETFTLKSNFDSPNIETASAESVAGWTSLSMSGYRELGD